MSGTGAVGSVNEGASSSGVASVLKVLTAKVDVEATAGPSGLSHLTIGGLPKVSEIAGPSGMSGLSPAEEQQRRRETQLRQHSFFQLRVHLISGHGLVAMDKSGKIFVVVRMRRVNTFRCLLGVSGTSDPYVKFKVGGRLLYKSKTVHKDLNPVWDETFVVPVEDPFQPIVIKVMSNIHQFYQQLFNTASVIPFGTRYLTMTGASRMISWDRQSCTSPRWSLTAQKTSQSSWRTLSVHRKTSAS